MGTGLRSIDTDSVVPNRDECCERYLSAGYSTPLLGAIWVLN